MRIFTTDKPRTGTGVMLYAKVDFVDCIDLRLAKTVIRRPGGEDDQIDATLISGKLMPDGQYLYFEDYDAANVDPDKRNAIFVVKSVSESAIGRNQYRLQFKELHAA